MGVQVLPISVDSVFVHKMWNDNELSKMIGENMPFPMLNDPGGEIGKLYGVYNSKTAKDDRGRFIIDPDGVIQAIEILAPPVGRNVNEALRQIIAFQHVRNTGGKEVLPSGWRPGKTVLRPGPELVGNVWKNWSVEEAFSD